MKKLISTVLLVCLIFCLTACGSSASSAGGTAGGTSVSSQQGNSEADSGGSGIDVDKGLLTTTITLPTSFFETFYDDDEPFDADAYVQELKVSEYVIDAWENEDGSVAFTLTRGDHERMMADMRAQIEDVASVAENYPFVQKIETNNDCTNVKVYVTKEEYESGFNFFVTISYEFQALMYQAFNGTPENNVIIETIDAETNTVIDTLDSAELAATD